MRYPHIIVITRTPLTVNTSSGGIPTEGTATTIYSGKCDAQENSKQFEVASGIVSSKGSATVFLPDGKVQLRGIAAGDSAVLTWTSGITTSGRINSTNRLDDGFQLLYS